MENHVQIFKKFHYISILNLRLSALNEIIKNKFIFIKKLTLTILCKKIIHNMNNE